MQLNTQDRGRKAGSLKWYLWPQLVHCCWESEELSLKYYFSGRAFQWYSYGNTSAEAP